MSENNKIPLHLSFRYVLAAIIIMMTFSLSSYGQHLLDKKISITVHNKPLQQTLIEIGRQGDFYFSYNSSLLPGDSIVNVVVRQKPVKDILQSLLGNGYEYHETADYIIIRKYVADGKAFTISGYVIDKKTGEKISDASVYELGQFISTLTDDEGRFRLRLHNRSPDISIQVSKLGFNDTLYLLHSGQDQTVALSLSPIRTISLKPVTITPNYGIQKYGLGKWLISSRQKISDINISDFFVRQPFQYSVWPGIGTHGKLSAQAVNKFSFNIFGGYSGGTRGVEVGGLFNMDKQDAQYVQVAGIFNIIGGSMAGVQVAGLYNTVADSSTGVQVAGLANITGKEVTGVQAAGIINTAAGVSGVQVAAVENISRGPTNGVQVSGLFNYARKLRGLQIGLLNIADTAVDGYGIGLVNVYKHHGYYKLSFSWNEAMSLNMAIKTGRPKLYSILLAGVDLSHRSQTFSVGYGLGRESRFNRRLSITTELTEQNLIVGYKNDVPVLVRVQPALQVRLSKNLSLFAGPSFSVFFAGSSETTSGDIPPMPPSHHFSLWHNTTAWFGAQAGVSLF